ncbi:hypothetical protein [Alicyclobacillus mali (ex Roth et al. 2021)]|uniref:hypothetical protein n=1 Tax=Alicyclobacillus mali (ex Roth et al. 2021) TaxID=1123961 RepID=UPI001E50661B|nr:hypothetical protein [Alicyclobacillus mali (ex Roth et al. 2021)]
MKIIESFPSKYKGFPIIYKEESPVLMGSFARSTKIRTLDDVDLIIVFSAQGSTYTESSDKIEVHVPESAPQLRRLCDDGVLNSRRVLNLLKAFLSEVPQYDNSEIHRSQEAVTLHLSSYDWNFDIVPAFITKPRVDGRTYYVIPDGRGAWKFTDPRIDAKRATDTNQRHDGRVLGLIRLLKYWNRRCAVPAISSYLLENMAISFFEKKRVIGSVGEALRDLFTFISTAVYSPCPDPKGIQGNLNNLDDDVRDKVHSAAASASKQATAALYAEAKGDHEIAIEAWKRIFGSEFPGYG